MKAKTSRWSSAGFAFALAVSANPSFAQVTNADADTSGTASITVVPQNVTPEMRLARIGYRIAQANADVCEAPEMMSGMSLHDIASYDQKQRAEIEGYYKLGRGFGIMDVVPGSAADVAGLRVGDVITAVDGASLDAFGASLIGASETYARVELLLGDLSERMQTHDVRLTVSRHGKTQEVAIHGDRGCSGKFVVYNSGKLNAWSDGRYVALTTRIMDFAGDDDQIAFVVGHEMAHNILGHARKSNMKPTLLAKSVLGAAGSRGEELQADALGAALVSRAGFNQAAPIQLLKKTAIFDLLSILSFTHPTSGRRIAIVKNALAWYDAISGKRNVQLAMAEPAITVSHAAFSTSIKVDHSWVAKLSFASVTQLKIKDATATSGVNRVRRVELASLTSALDPIKTSADPLLSRFKIDIQLGYEGILKASLDTRV